jgi:hypothetical protein
VYVWGDNCLFSKWTIGTKHSNAFIGTVEKIVFNIKTVIHDEKHMHEEKSKVMREVGSMPYP